MLLALPQCLVYVLLPQGTHAARGCAWETLRERKLNNEY